MSRRYLKLCIIMQAAVLFSGSSYSRLLWAGSLIISTQSEKPKLLIHTVGDMLLESREDYPGWVEVRDASGINSQYQQIVRNKLAIELVNYYDVNSTDHHSYSQFLEQQSYDIVLNIIIEKFYIYRYPGPLGELHRYSVYADVAIIDGGTGDMIKKLSVNTSSLLFTPRPQKPASEMGGSTNKFVGKLIKEMVKISQQLQEKLKKRLAAQRTLEEKQKLEREAPAVLSLAVNFNDSASAIPNLILDAGEKAFIELDLENLGEGVGFGLLLVMSSDNKQVNIYADSSIGDLGPSKKQKISIPIDALVDAPDGLVNIAFIVKEKRGYDARPIQLQIPVRHLDKPALEITSQQLNDRKSGLADGNGNGVPENNETIELNVFVKNSGVGDALGVNLNLASITSGVEKVQETFSIGTIEPQQTKEGKIVFRIPRTFNAAQIDYEISAEDKIGASRASRKFSEALSRRVPILAYDYRMLNSQGTPVDRIHNGANFVLEITPRNNGAIEANGVNLQLAAPTGITLASSSQLVGHLAQNAVATPIRFSFTVPRSFASPNAIFRIDFSQTDFSGKQDNISVPLALKQPNLTETHQIAETNRNGVIEQGENVELSFQILNTGDLEAENVRMTLDIANSSVDFRDREKLVGTILPGHGETVKFNFFVKFSTTPGPLPVSLKITQADFPNFNKSITEYAIKEVGAQVVTITGEEQKRIAPAAAPRSVNAAPVIIIGAPRDGDTIYEDRISLVGSVTDDRAINAIEIRLNGQIVAEVERGVALTQKPQTVDPKQRAFDRVLALQSGSNIISVIAYDTDNAREEKTIAVTRAREQAEIWAVVIGIGNYPKVPPLEYSVKDAMAFRDYLVQNFGIAPDHIETLINEQATTQQFRKMLGTELRRKVRKQDMVIIYYAGHGAPEPDTESPDGDGLEKYILPFDADPNDLYSTGIRMTDIADIFQRLSAERLVFIADACYSGASGGRTILSGRRANLSPAFLDRIAQGKGRVILTASDANEVSVESKNFGGGHGAFTFHLLEGLRGKADYDQNGDITVDEAFQYVSKTVPSATGQKQHPMKKGEMVGQMILGRVK